MALIRLESIIVCALPVRANERRTAWKTSMVIVAVAALFAVADFLAHSAVVNPAGANDDGSGGGEYLVVQ